MIARNFGKIIGYLYAIVWIWRYWHGVWTSGGRDLMRLGSDSHGWWTLTSGGNWRKAEHKLAIGKRN